MTEKTLIEQLQDAHRRDDQKEVERLEVEFAAQARGRVAEIEQSFSTVKHVAENAEVVVSVSKGDVRKANGEKRRRYKELIELYRKAFNLAKEISDVKKTMRGGEDAD